MLTFRGIGVKNFRPTSPQQVVQQTEYLEFEPK